MQLWPVAYFFHLASRLDGFAVALLLHPPKSDDKNGQEMINWSFRNWNTTYKIHTLVVLFWYRVFFFQKKLAVILKSAINETEYVRKKYI